MKNFTNRYIFIFASVMVIIVAPLLSLAATALKPFQEKNIEIAKKTDILKSINKAEKLDQATNKIQYVESEYNKYIVDSYIIDINGNKKEGDAFKVDAKKELAKGTKDRNLPLFVAQLDDGSKKTIIPVYGKGLWGPIWGYISLNDDNNTLYGAVFDHKTETPGLGAEINTAWFQAPFKGKKLFGEDGKFVSIKVYKGGKGAAEMAGDQTHGVDAISGGTITSKALEKMIEVNVEPYTTFLKNN